MYLVDVAGDPAVGVDVEGGNVVSELGGGLQATKLHIGATRPVGRTVLVLSRIAGISPHDICITASGF